MPKNALGIRRVGGAQAYPAGAKPGFNPNHVASSNCRFSVVNTGNGAINLLRGTAGVVTNFTQVIDSNLGPAQNSLTDGTQCIYSFSGGPTAAETKITYACIIRAGASAFNKIILANCEVGAFNAGAYLKSNNLNVSINVPPSGAGSSGFTLTQGIPYFLGASIDSSGNYTQIISRLDTRSVIYTESGTTTGIANTATTGHFYVGAFETAGSGFLGQLSAAMFSATWLGLTQWRQFASDPWSFWYPNNDAAIFAGIGKPTAAVSAAVFRKTLSLIGGRVGTRQPQG